MNSKALKTIYREYFQEKLKSSKEYKGMFSKAVEYENKYLKTISKEDRDKIEELVDNFIGAEDQMLEDTFVNVVKYSYKIFQEIKNFQVI